jgi:hypothetical protein
MTLHRVFILLVVFGLALGLSASVYAQTAINPGDSVQGTLNNNTAQYNFTAKAGETVIISLNSDAFDPLLELYAANGNQVGRDDDSGGFPNARLVFTAPADGTYTITVTSFSGAATGAYTLSLTTQTATAITYGTPVDTKMAGTTPLYFTFNGTEGDVVDIYAVSAADEDTRLTLRGPDGVEVIGDDDSGAGANPYIRRLILPSTGAYQLELAPFSDLGLSGDITVTIEQTELLALSETPQTVDIGGDIGDVEVFSMEATAGTTYRIVVELDADNSSGASIEILSPGSTFPDIGVNAYGTTSRLALDFTPTTSGQTIVRVRNSSFSDTPSSVTVSLQPVE